MDVENKIYKCFKIRKRKETKKKKDGKEQVYESYQGLAYLNRKVYCIRLKGETNTFFGQIDEYIKKKNLTELVNGKIKELRENLVF